MKRFLGVSLVAFVLVSAGCGNSVDPVAAPTPTPTETPTPTPTGTPSDRSGTYNISVTPPAMISCDGYSFTFNVPSVAIVESAGAFTPDWGFSPGTFLSLPDPEHGTITGDNFVVNYTYCDYVSASNTTVKHVVTWTGTFTGASFDSTLTQKLRLGAGNLVSSCGAGELDPTVTTAFTTASCTDPGISWALHGAPQ